MILKGVVSLTIGLLMALPSGAMCQDQLDSLERELREIAKNGEAVGVQVAVRGSTGLLYSGALGMISDGGDKAVDEETLFLIASCSKPIASTCALTLVQDDTVSIELEDSISRWIPEYGGAELREGGVAERPPTVEEVMCHRAGIYSQKSRMTQQQSRWIRDFRLTLEESVNGIVASPLVGPPGAQYAYSGAGYCVLGRVAELASGESFESLLQERICQPLGMSRTTYFPAGRFPDDEIATGTPRKTSPHLLGERHRLPLIGGSLYTTAEDMTLFGVAICDAWGNSDDNPLGLSQQMIREAGRPRSEQSQYGLGWKVVKRNGKVIRLSHSGALNSHRAWFVVDLEKGISVAGCWTLTDPGRQAPVTEALQRFLIGN